jgi:competence protein ComEC
MLHPADTSAGRAAEHDNELSCVLRVSTGRPSLLLAADIEQASEQRLLALHGGKLATTLLVAPHHGSKSSSSQSFVDAVRPEYAVFTTGYRNRFGHPRDEVLARYRAGGSRILRSDEDGAISAVMDREGVLLASHRAERRRYWQHGAG